ncbi:MAG TPA: DUF3788 family protein [bacterium]|nr:DUF3788 family protein [bacterium]
MERPVLSNKEQYPTDEIIYAHLGAKKTHWSALFEYLHTHYPDFCSEWRYYLDGKSWLMKVTRGKQTIFWLSLVQGTFRTTFYFNRKAEEAIQQSALSAEMKAQYRAGIRSNRICGLTVVYSAKRDVRTAQTLIALKAGLK